MNKLLVGPVGSGKTSGLFAIYHRLVQEGSKTDEILVLVINASAVKDWRRRMVLPTTGNLNIFTYFGFIQREVSRNWPTLVLPGEEKTPEPVFMTTETAHYLMACLVDSLRAEGYFADIRATSQQIAIQLIDNLNQAAINGLSLEQAHLLLNQAAQGDEQKERAYGEAVGVMQRFRDHCIRSRRLDYSLTVQLFSQLLLSQEYLESMPWKHLLVDNLEETVPAAQDLIFSLISRVKGAYLAYDPKGGHGEFFGAAPILAWRRFSSLCEVENLACSHLSKPEISQFASDLAAKILGKESSAAYQTPSIILGEIHGQYRGEMIELVSGQLKSLIAAGTEPHEIAIISPVIDKVLEFSLQNSLNKGDIPLAILSRGKRLIDQPFAQVLISLALLIYPQWRLETNYSGLLQTISLLLQLDPLRSALLAESIFKHKLLLPDLDASGLRERIGFDKAEKYEQLKGWIEQKRGEQPQLDLLFQQVFGELLAPLGPSEQDLLACRQVIDSVVKFYRVMQDYPFSPEPELGKSFLKMVLSGTLAAETLFQPPENTGKIILATPYTFLFSPFVPPVKYQFWLDISGDQWLRGIVKELTNPHILSRSWDADVTWNDTVDQNTRFVRLARYVEGLLGKCGEGLYIASSFLSGQGYEQDSAFSQFFGGQGVGIND